MEKTRMKTIEQSKVRKGSPKEVVRSTLRRISGKVPFEFRLHLEWKPLLVILFLYQYLGKIRTKRKQF